MKFADALAVAQELGPEEALSLAPHDKRELQDALLAETVRLAYEGHTYYRAVMTAEGLVPADIRTTDDLVRLPVTTKADFLADPDAFRLRVDGGAPELSTLWDVVYTTGTSTGVPAPVYSTTFDHLAYMHVSRRRAPFIPLGEGDVICNLFPITPFPMGAYTRAISEALACGSALVLAQTGRPPQWFGSHRSLGEAARLAESSGATVLWGVASFVRRLLLHAEEHGIDLSAVRMVMITGEASSPDVLESMRARMRRLGCRDDIVINRYGSTEQGATMVECTPGSGFHNLAPDHVFLEIVDPSSGARLPDGQEGHLAFTHLLRRGTLLLRYAPGDVASLDHAPCPSCGRIGSERMSAAVRRVGSVQKVKGTLVDLDAVRVALEKLEYLEEFQVVIRATDPEAPEVADDLAVRFAARSGCDESAPTAILETVRQIASLRPTLVPCAAADIFDPDGAPKARRIVDERELRK